MWQDHRVYKSIEEPIPLRSADAEFASELPPSAILSEFYKGSGSVSLSLSFSLFASSWFHPPPTLSYSLSPARSVPTPSLFSAYSTDILYISVGLLAPYKSIFALSPESNLSVSAGSGPATVDAGQENAFEYKIDSIFVSPPVTSILL